MAAPRSRGDSLAAGAPTASFTASDHKDAATLAHFDEAVKNVKPSDRAVFCGCNAKGCEEFVAYSSKEFSDHVHEVHIDPEREIPSNT
jgi:hypothetical protein